MPQPRIPRGKSLENHNRRGFDEIFLRDVGYQRGADRFNESNVEPHALVLNPWRLNLTGLSHVYNLYFVAYEDEVHVYLPRFPDQYIAPRAAVVILLPTTRADLPGHMPYSKPHSVNNLHISSLGDEETIICACDDGDVIAYHTSILANEVNLVTEARKQGKYTYADIKPFFHVNVGASAWGLAVHAKHRMIAVSANNHLVTVYSFGLIDPEEQRTLPTYDIIEQGEDLNLEAKKSKTKIKPSELEWGESHLHEDQEQQSRSTNLVYQLAGHDTNIPSITFCDSGGSSNNPPFLASTDIKGHIKLWSITTQEVLTEMVPIRNPLDISFYGYRQRLAGWGILQLDKRSFSKTKSVKEAYGSCHLFGHQRKLVCDISASRKFVRNAAESWEYSSQRNSASLVIGDNDMDNTDVHDIEMESEDSISANHELRLSMSELSDESDADVTLAEGRIPVKYYRQLQYPIFSYKPSTEINRSENNFPASPLMLLHPQAVHLFQNPDFTMQGPTSPVVFLDDPLHQLTSPQHSNIFKGCDRLSLHMQIPELGVVLIGSPKGRVAVLTLHQIETDASHPTLGPPKGPVYTMRLDHIIPFASQEDSQQRPMPHLVGLAASPLICSKASKTAFPGWRVILMYSEHSVLSYRIGRGLTGGTEDLLIC